MQHNIDPFWNGIWKAKLHERHKMMIWRIAAGYLPTKDKLSRFIDIGDVFFLSIGWKLKPPFIFLLFVQ